jgi:hypothetical protein
MKKEIWSCDVCKKEGRIEAIEIQVIFTTDQTEGRSISPYLSREKVEICQDCMNKILQGNYLFAHGAQGYNTYYFKQSSPQGKGE